MRLTPLLQESQVRLPLRATESHDILRELADLAEVHKWTSSAAQLLDRLLDRERQSPTAVGAGIAIPHAKLPSVKTVELALGVAPEGVDFGRQHGVHLFFMVLSAPADPSTHIRVLAQISRLARTGRLPELWQSPTAVDLLARLAQLEGSLET